MVSSLPLTSLLRLSSAAGETVEFLVSSVSVPSPVVRHDLGDHLTANHLQKVVASSYPELGRGHSLGGRRRIRQAEHDQQQIHNMFHQYSHVDSIVGPVVLKFDVAIYPTIMHTCSCLGEWIRTFQAKASVEPGFLLVSST